MPPCTAFYNAEGGVIRTTSHLNLRQTGILPRTCRLSDHSDKLPSMALMASPDRRTSHAEGDGSPPTPTTSSSAAKATAPYLNAGAATRDLTTAYPSSADGSDYCDRCPIRISPNSAMRYAGTVRDLVALIPV